MTSFFGNIISGSNDLRLRIFNVLPAAGYQMDRLLQLMDVVESDLSPTACVECRVKPRMHLNPEFVEEHCQRDEHLFMLVMHELYHVILGHTRLFERVTPLHNFVFDAVINSMLCHEFPEPVYREFFCKLNDWNSFPARLLRPPPNWRLGGEVEMPEDARLGEVAVIELLYGGSREDNSNITYHDVFKVVAGCLQEIVSSEDTDKFFEGAVLLGDHSGESLSGELDQAVLSDDAVQDVVRKIVEKWPPPDKPISGRDDGRSPSDFFLQEGRNPQAKFHRELRKLFGKAGILKHGNSRNRSWERNETVQEARTPLPQLDDRRAPGLEIALGFRPFFFDVKRKHHRGRLTPRDTAYVYLDISGSMWGVLASLTTALREPHRKGEVKLFVFSTLIDEVEPRIPFDRQNLQNTGGTDIACVYSHLANLPKPETPKRVVVLTDGYVGQPNRNDLNVWKERKVKLYVGLVGQGYMADLLPHAFEVRELPAFD
ncbi:MAG: hypothetical protein CMI26_00475 [Opitutae bacterium]|jgi:hypothetical protein|nr:hypothetical protein [Opitutae bacterium]|tara:strand:- start:153 stop:1610 length:1458 start_codon:yes stop_codon:yes gene_type:complete